MIAGTARNCLRRVPLPAALLVSLVSVGLLQVGIDGWRAMRMHAAAVASDETQTANLARSLAGQVHDLVRAADMIAVGLRERVETNSLTPGHSVRLDEFMAMRLAALPLVNNLSIIDADGERVAPDSGTGSRRFSSADRDFFHYHRSNPDRGPLIGPPIRSRANGEWVFTVTRRIDKPDGSFNGVAVVTVSIGALQHLYATFDVAAHGVIALDSTQGRVLVRAPSEGAAIGEDVSGTPLFSRFLPHQPTGSFSYLSPLDDVYRLGSYRRVDDYPLVILVAHGLDAVLTGWRVDTELHLGISISVALVLGGLGVWFARQIRLRQQAERRYQLLADNSSDAILCVAADGRRLYVSPSLSKLTGWSAEEIAGQGWGALMHPEDRQVMFDAESRLRAGTEPVTSVLRCLRKDGSPLWVEARIQLLEEEGDGPAPFVASIRDVTDRRAAETEVVALNHTLAAQANTDALTGLANRRRFDEVIDQECRRSMREAYPLSLLMIDVDVFKAYNDHYGHPGGDACLRRVSAAIGQFGRRPGDILARYGGEEFAMLLSDAEPGGAAEVAERVRAAVEAARIEHVGNAPGLVVTASIGVATIMPRPGAAGPAVADLIAAADAALYAAKRGGRNRVVVQAAAANVPRPAGDTEPASRPQPPPAEGPRRAAELRRPSLILDGAAG